MSKFIKSMLCIMGICVLFLGGCSNGVGVKDSPLNKEEAAAFSSERTGDETGESNQNQVTVPSEETENKIDLLNDNTNTYSKKQIYLEKLNELETNLNESLKERYDSGITQQMLEAGSEEFEKWDNMLNEIYSILKEQLTTEEMDKLTAEELNWINGRDEKVKQLMMVLKMEQ